MKSPFSWIFRFLRTLKFKSFTRVLSFNREPILICGCGRSGTSLLLAILDAHPSIHGINYETNIFVWRRFFRNHKVNGLVHRLRIFNQLVKADIKSTARRWCEKTPRNVEYLPLILEELNERVKIIHIIRDGRDVCTSYHPTTEGYHVPVERWVNNVADGLKFKDHPNLLTVRYESLVLDFEKTIKEVLDFLGESYSEAIKTFHKVTQIESHSAWFDGVKPLNGTSVGKWLKDEHSLRLKEIYSNPDAVQLLNDLGYLNEK